MVAAFGPTVNVLAKSCVTVNAALAVPDVTVIVPVLATVVLLFAIVKLSASPVSEPAPEPCVIVIQVALDVADQGPFAVTVVPPGVLRLANP